MGDGLTPLVRLAPTFDQQSDIADLAAIEDFAMLLIILLAQPDAEIAIPQMHRPGLLSAMRGRCRAGGMVDEIAPALDRARLLPA
jgi:hypothetical protein